MSEASQPADPWKEVLTLVVPPMRLLKPQRAKVLITVCPGGCPVFIESEPQGIAALDSLAAWWAINGREKPRHVLEELRDLDEAILCLSDAWAKAQAASQSEFLEAHHKAWSDLKDAAEENWPENQLPYCLSPFYSATLPSEIIKRLKLASENAISDLPKVAGKTIARGRVRHLIDVAENEVSNDSPDFQVAVCLARWFYEATGEEPKTITPPSHDKADDPESAKTLFEKLVFAVADQAFYRTSETRSFEHSTLRRRVLRPVARYFCAVALQQNSTNSLLK